MSISVLNNCKKIFSGLGKLARERKILFSLTLKQKQTVKSDFLSEKFRRQIFPRFSSQTSLTSLSGFSLVCRYPASDVQ
jgi:hypothetical protein